MPRPARTLASLGKAPRVEHENDMKKAAPRALAERRSPPLRPCGRGLDRARPIG